MNDGWKEPGGIAERSCGRSDPALKVTRESTRGSVVIVGLG